MFTDDFETPYQISFRVRGVKAFFFNMPNVDEYERRDTAPKGRGRTQKDPETMVWRGEAGALAMPGDHFIKAMAEAARGYPDPTKSGHRSMKPVVRKAMSAHEDLCTFVHRNGRGESLVKNWDAIDKRLGRYGSNTMAPVRRPILEAGWETVVSIDVNWPAIFAPADIVRLMNMAGNQGVGDAIGIGYGRFVVVKVDDPTEVSWT